MKLPGLDAAWQHPTPDQMAAGGWRFICRYHSWDTTGKNLTKPEADSYRAKKILVVSNWEYSTGAPLNGWTQGVSDATEGLRQKLMCGGDPKAPIYFSLDENAPASAQPAINAYYDACASVLGSVNLVGMYGGYWQIRRAFDAGVIKWGWQTYAWSLVYSGVNDSPYATIVNLRGQNFWFDTRAQLRQIENGIYVGGANVDRNESQVDNFGQWYYEGGNERTDIMPAIVAHDPAGSLVVVWTTDDGMAWQNIQRPETEAAWLAACGGGPRAEVPNVSDLAPNISTLNSNRDAQRATATAKALKDAGIGTGGISVGTGKHHHDFGGVPTGAAVPD